MKNIFTGLLVFCYLIVHSQEKTQCYDNYSQYKADSPSIIIDFKPIKRSTGDQIMMGGISNYTFKRVKPKKLKKKLTKEIWGVKQDGKVYINQFPFTKFKYYNELIGIGYVSYFVGLPPGAMDKQNQLELGFINPGQGSIYITHSVGYVLLKDGAIKYLSPEFLTELVAGQKTLEEEVANTKFSSNDYLEMFRILDKLNKIKN